MRSEPILVTASLVIALTIGSMNTVLAQAPLSQNRVAQQVMIGGLRVDAAYVMAAGGGVQSYSCPGPQQYVTPDGASQGWACFDPTTNVWLLSALPPQQQAPAPAPAPPPVVVQQVIQQPVYAPPVIYQYPVVQPAVIYRTPPRIVYAAPVYAAPVYSSSAIVGAAAIGAAGRIAAAVIATSGYHDHRGGFYVVGNHGYRH
jgi:hypothetical protein